MIHLAGPAILVAVLAGTGVYGILARRNAVLVLIGAELLLAAAGVLFVLATTLPAGGLGMLESLPPPETAPDGSVTVTLVAGDALLSGQVATIMLITVAAAEIGLALAVVLLLYRARATSDLAAVRDLGEGAPTVTDPPADGSTVPLADAGIDAGAGAQPAEGAAR